MKFSNENKTDNQCFKWCIARALNPVKDHLERITGKLEEQAETLNFKNMSFPVKLRDINKFDIQNPNISVNVLGYDDDEDKKKLIYPLRISEMDKRLHEVNLLMLEDKILMQKQNKCEAYYVRGRHSNCDCLHLNQNYFKLPCQTIREYANFFCLFPQDQKNIDHIFNDHVSQDMTKEQFKNCVRLHGRSHTILL